MIGGYIADCFSGSGSVAKKIRQAGFAAREWDLILDPRLDLCRRSVRRAIVCVTCDLGAAGH